MSRTRSGPAGDVSRRRRPEGSEVALHETLEALCLRRVVRADPVLGGGEQVGASPLPGPGRRNTDEVEPQSDVSRRQQLDLVAVHGSSASLRKRLARRCIVAPLIVPFWILSYQSRRARRTPSAKGQ